MSYQVDDSKLITIGNLRNFHDRFWDEMVEEHDNMMNMFAPGGAAVTTNADIDEALFGISGYQEQCPEEENGIHIWNAVGEVGGDGYGWKCQNCEAFLRDYGAEPDNPCAKGEHNWVLVSPYKTSGGHFVCSICGMGVDTYSDSPANDGY